MSVLFPSSDQEISLPPTTSL